MPRTTAYLGRAFISLASLPISPHQSPHVGKDGSPHSFVSCCRRNEHIQRGGGSSIEGTCTRRHMKATPALTGDQYEAGLYEIRLKGHLDDKWTDWFDGLTITRPDNGETLLRGQVVDQAALHGVLRQVRDLGLPLL